MATISRRRLMGGVGAAAVALAGCGAPNDADDGATAPVTTRTVKHPLGTSEVPVTPRRVIALDAGAGLQTSLECRASLIAAETLEGDQRIPDYLPAPPPDFTYLGFNQIDLERIVGLAPDLIIGSKTRIAQAYPKLSEIAPTVPFLNTADRVPWRDTITTVADVLGAAPAIEARKRALSQRITRFQQAHAKALATMKVALVRFTAEEVRILTGLIFPSDVLHSCTVERPASNTAKSAEDTYISLSPENVSVLRDADVIIYCSGGGGFARQSGKLVTSVINGGLWRKLPAVQKGRAHEVSAVTWWDGYSVAAALACIDDLDQILG